VTPTDPGHAVLDGAPFPVVISALDDGTILYANPAVLQSMQASLPEVLGRPAGDFWTDPGVRDQVMARLRAEGVVHGMEIRTRRADGAPAWLRLSVSRVDYQGRPASCSTFADITELKETQLQLRESELKHRLLIENSHDIIYTLAPTGVFTFTSPAFQVQLGWPITEVVGQHFARFTHPDDVADCHAFLGQVLQSGRAMGNFEHRVLHRDGSWRWFLTNAVPLLDAEGQVLGLEGCASNLDERKALQARAARTERASSLGTMAAGMAHEINNPLTYALSGLQYAEERLRALPMAFRAAWPRGEEGGLADLEEALAEASQGARRVRDLVADLRALAAGQHAPDARCDLAGALGRAARVARHAFRPEAELALELPALPSLSGSEAEVVQLFAALLINAGQATDGRAELVRVSAERRDRLVAVRVADDGPGMPPALLARVFDPFATTREAGTGRGLGLPVALAIARGLGGDVEVQSTPGKGTTVTVTLPAAR
jgi:PAS domain S-box-containing protein